jgi:hypothetical protein
VGNLRLAGLARRVVILEPSAGDLPRTFFAADGKSLFDELCRRAEVMSYEELLASLARILGAAGDGT